MEPGTVEAARERERGAFVHAPGAFGIPIADQSGMGVGPDFPTDRLPAARECFACQKFVGIEHVEDRIVLHAGSFQQGAVAQNDGQLHGGSQFLPFLLDPVAAPGLRDPGIERAVLRERSEVEAVTSQLGERAARHRVSDGHGLRRQSLDFAEERAQSLEAFRVPGGRCVPVIRKPQHAVAEIDRVEPRVHAESGPLRGEEIRQGSPSRNTFWKGGVTGGIRPQPRSPIQELAGRIKVRGAPPAETLRVLPEPDWRVGVVNRGPAQEHQADAKIVTTEMPACRLTDRRNDIGDLAVSPGVVTKSQSHIFPEERLKHSKRHGVIQVPRISEHDIGKPSDIDHDSRHAVLGPREIIGEATKEGLCGGGRVLLVEKAEVALQPTVVKR